MMVNGEQHLLSQKPEDNTLFDNNTSLIKVLNQWCAKKKDSKQHVHSVLGGRNLCAF